MIIDYRKTVVVAIIKDWKSCGGWMDGLLNFALGVILPIWIPFLFLKSIVQVIQNKGQNDSKEMLIALSGIEASLEALPQLILQFT